jgi:hypothetical protein
MRMGGLGQKPETELLGLGLHALLEMSVTSTGGYYGRWQGGAYKATVAVGWCVRKRETGLVLGAEYPKLSRRGSFRARLWKWG